MFRKGVWVASVSLQYNQAETIKKMVVGIKLTVKSF